MSWYIPSSIPQVLLTGWLPSILSSLWASLAMPRYLHLFAMARGMSLNLTHLDRQVVRYYWW